MITDRVLLRVGKLGENFEKTCSGYSMFRCTGKHKQAMEIQFKIEKQAFHNGISLSIDSSVTL